MTNIRRIAEKAGVSIATVSRVVNGSAAVAPDLRDRVLKAVNRFGYTPTVGRRASTSIGLVYTGPFSVGSPYDMACIAGIVSALEESEFDLSMVHLRRDKRANENYSQFFFRKGIRGAILRSTSADRDIVCGIAEEGFPSVVLGDHFDDPRPVFVYNESRKASREGLEHLVSLGHQRIAFAVNDIEDGDHLDRLEAYRETLRDHGIYDPSLEFRVPAHQLDGAQLIRKMMSLVSPPTAVYFADPFIAEGAIKETHRIGLEIPGEFSILGFDDADARHTVFPAMTAICQDARLLGRLAFEVLVRHCAEKPTQRKAVVPGSAWLEINHTTGRAPNRAVRVLPNGDRMEPAIT